MAGVTIDPNDRGVAYARELAEKIPGSLLLDQYSNPSNPRAYQKWLAPRIRYIGDRKVVAIGVAVGSCGTFNGLTDALDAPDVDVVGAISEKDSSTSGMRTEKELERVPLYRSHPKVPYARVTGADARAMSRKICSLPIACGPTGGAAALAVLRHLESEWKKDWFQRLKVSNGKVCAAFICPDSQDRYLSGD